MCHRRGDWSRTSSRVSEPEDERERDGTAWTVRAKERLAAFLASDEGDTADRPERPAVETEGPTVETERPAADTEPETPTPEAPESDASDDAVTDSEEEEAEESEREGEPIPADD
ncbi:hypothetical protein [Halorussus aquaticus]|uniref:Uncharacterized protein n=1 Tax=Halorussus aquaticus TaxID=2953748 RepID=A0ABD5Q674_9EURY|nr:hypothetical protein [Halorussus aquaticus]